MSDVEKIHSLYELGLELADPAKKAIIKPIKKKAPSPCCISCIITRIERLTPKEFLNSKFGKPLKIALEKQGMSQGLLESTKQQLLEDRKKRREEEKTKYNLEQNEFPPDDDLNLETKELYEAIFEEYGENFSEKYRKMHLEMEMFDNINEMMSQEDKLKKNNEK